MAEIAKKMTTAIDQVRGGDVPLDTGELMRGLGYVGVADRQVDEKQARRVGSDDLANAAKAMIEGKQEE